MPQVTARPIASMLKFQDEMNAIVNPNWRTAGYDWALAILMEAAEAIEHHGYKWWKKQVPDMPAVQMELVDIWHFALSDIILKEAEIYGKSFEQIAAEIVAKIPLEESESDLTDCLRSIVGQAARGEFSVHTFSNALTKSGMTFDSLYTSYIGKNVLNRFRQSRGYKSGEYIKDWSAYPLIKPLTEPRPLEDNDHLQDILLYANTESPVLFDELVGELDERYREVLAAEVEKNSPRQTM
jgi:dimeric dUTPase (all-alpha-NTP-PPase superfamily)